MRSFGILPYALLIFTLIILHSFIKRVRYKSHKGKCKLLPLPPGPASWPVVGCAPDVLRNKPAGRWILRRMEEMNTNIACFRIGNTHVIPVTDPKIAQEILKKQDTTFASRPVSVAAWAFSGGYMTAVISPYGEQWKKMRRVLTSEIICPARHLWLHDKRVEEADNLMKHAFYQCKSLGQVNLRHTTRHYCGNVIRRLVFNKRYFGKGRQDGGPTIDEEQHVDALFDALNYLYAFCVSDYFPFLEGLDLDGHEKVVKECTRTFRRLHEPIINERIKQWRDNMSLESKRKEPQDLLDVLIMLKDSKGRPLLTPPEVKAQATEIMMAAVDNPSNATEWAMAEMINRPELLQKAKEEINRVVGKERLVQESDIP